MSFPVRERVAAETALERHQKLMSSKLGFVPFSESINILPGFELVAAPRGFAFRKEAIAGYIGIHYGVCMHKVPFELITHWSREDITTFIKPDKLARKIMRSLYPKLMEAKVNGLIDHFKIKGLTFEKEYGTENNYFTY